MCTNSLTNWFVGEHYAALDGFDFGELCVIGSQAELTSAGVLPKLKRPTEFTEGEALITPEDPP